MATTDLVLENATEYYQLAAAGEDYFATNVSGYPVHVRSGVAQPADSTSGHIVQSMAPIMADPAVIESVWVMCAMPNATIRKN